MIPQLLMFGITLKISHECCRHSNNVEAVYYIHFTLVENIKMKIHKWFKSTLESHTTRILPNRGGLSLYNVRTIRTVTQNVRVDNIM